MKDAKKTVVLSSDELSILCWQLGQLCKAGISLQDGSSILLQDASTPKVKAALERLREPLAAGEPLSVALEEAGGFPDYMLRMVLIGQAAGRLEQVLTALSAYYKREAATADAVRRAVTYPAVMAALIALVFLVLVLRVMPVFAQVFSQLGTGLSPVASLMLSAGTSGKYIAGGFALLLLAGAVFMLLYFRGANAMALFSKGATGMAIARGRFSSAMSLMLRSGLPLDEAMQRTQELLSDTPLAAAMAACREQIADGVSFPKAVEESGMLVGMEAGLLAAGFRTGASEAAMDEVADRCQSESEAHLARLLGRFEYSLVVVLCLAVGLVLLSVMLPLLSVLSAIGG